MQNKANFRNFQMSVSNIITMNYKKFIPLAGYKNKPNSNPNKPNLRKAQMNVNVFIIKDYRKKDDFIVRINKPNFQNAKNEHKLIFYRGLRQCYRLPAKKNKPKQTQFFTPLFRVLYTLRGLVRRRRIAKMNVKSLAKKSGHTLLWIYLNLFLTPPGQTAKVPPLNLRLF